MFLRGQERMAAPNPCIGRDVGTMYANLGAGGWAKGRSCQPTAACIRGAEKERNTPDILRHSRKSDVRLAGALCSGICYVVSDISDSRCFCGGSEAWCVSRSGQLHSGRGTGSEMERRSVARFPARSRGGPSLLPLKTPEALGAHLRSSRSASHPTGSCSFSSSHSVRSRAGGVHDTSNLIFADIECLPGTAKF